jgi:hypothetical protein
MRNIAYIQEAAEDGGSVRGVWIHIELRMFPL